MSKFKVGDKVRKVTGYPFSGVVCATYDTEEKCCVKHKDRWEHIFSDKQLAYDHPEYQYLDLLRDILDTGDIRESRNGTIYSLFGRELKFNLQGGFPLFTTKRVHFKSIVGELLWMLSGSTNNHDLNKNGITIWDEWADPASGELGPIYGKQWRDFNGVDQIYNLCQGLIHDPYSRRHIVSAWNVSELGEMSLPPCHYTFQFYIAKGKLSCKVIMRSSDAPLGLPFNVAQYALLTHLIATETGYDVGDLIVSLGDVHIYENQIPGIKTQLEREPRPFPTLKFPKEKLMCELTIEDISVVDYDPHPAISIPVTA